MKARTRTMAVMTSAPGRRDAVAGRAPPDPPLPPGRWGPSGPVGPLGRSKGLLMASGVLVGAGLGVVREVVGRVVQRRMEELEQAGDQLGAVDDRLLVVVRAQAQGAVRRPGARHARDHPHLLAVGVLPGEQLGSRRVVGDLVVD